MDPLMQVYPADYFKTEPNHDEEYIDIKEEHLDEPIVASHFEECFVSNLPEYYSTESELDPELNGTPLSSVPRFVADLDGVCKSENVSEYSDCLCNELEGSDDPYADRYFYKWDENSDRQTVTASMTETRWIENADDEPVDPLVVCATPQLGFQAAIVAPKTSRTQTNDKKTAGKQGRPMPGCENICVGPSKFKANENTDADGFTRKQDVSRLEGVLIAHSIDDWQSAESKADDEGGEEMMALPVSDERAEPAVWQSGCKYFTLTPKQKGVKGSQRPLSTFCGENFDMAVTLLTGCDEIWLVKNEEQARALSLTTSGAQRPARKYKLQVRAETSDSLEQDLKENGYDSGDGVMMWKPDDESISVIEFEGIEFEQPSTVEAKSTKSDTKRRKYRKTASLSPEERIPIPSIRDCLVCGSWDGKPNGGEVNESQNKISAIIEGECTCAKAEKPQTNRRNKRKQTIVFRPGHCDDTAPPSIPNDLTCERRSGDRALKWKEVNWEKFIDDYKATLSRKRQKFESMSRVPPKAKKPLIMCKPSCKDGKFGNLVLNRSSLVGQQSSENNAGTVINKDRSPDAEPPKANRRKQTIVFKPESVVEPAEMLSASEDEADVMPFNSKVKAEVTKPDDDVMLVDADDKTSETQTDCETETHVDDSSSFFTCSECYKAFRSRSKLAAHRRTHYRLQSFQCLECEATFCTEFGLDCHVCSLGFVCKRCKLEHPSEWSVVSHECACDERMQTQKRASCKICGLNLTRRLLFQHIVETHPDVLARWNVVVAGEEGVEFSDVGDVQLGCLRSVT